MNIRTLTTLVAFVVCIRMTTASTCSYTYSQRYTVSCNFWNWGRCTRHRDATGYRCCTGWEGSSCTSQQCNDSPGLCRNSGTCRSSGYCSCRNEYYGTWCESSCPQISNCVQEQCSTYQNVRCISCDGDYGALGRAYMKSSDSKSCLKQCSWRSDSNACFPGYCTNGNCKCTTGFYGTDCRSMQATQSPKISYKSAQLHTMDTVVEATTASPVYTNLRHITSVQLNWIGLYRPARLPSYSNVPYINSVNLGVVDARGSIKIEGPHVTYGRWSTSFACPDGGTSSSPITGIVDCDVNFDSLPTWNIQSGDIITVDFQLQSGGNMKIYNRDSSNSIMTRYYNGRTTTESVTFTFDFDPPLPCSGNPHWNGCMTTMLNVGKDVTSNGLISVSWRDWSDAMSGIRSYHLEVRRMAQYGNTLSESYSQDPIYDHSTTTNDAQVSLPEAGMYSFVLSVVDEAGNQRLARRFVLFDNETPGPTVNEDNPIHVTSATPDTNFLWITKVEEPLTRIDLTWDGHFMSPFYQRLLIPIDEHRTGLVENDYDQTFGTITRHGLPNKLGVTQFMSYFDVDHNGGSTIMNPRITNTNVWQSENITVNQSYNIGVTDGDSIRFWIEARNIIGNNDISDSVLVHVDSSPPRLEDLWLQRNGEIQLSVHNTNNLHDMRIHFKAYDIHSGLRTIRYEVYDTENHTVKMEMALPVNKINASNCEPTSCVCTPLGECYDTEFEIVPNFHIGRHDYDYAIRLIVTNNAHLVANDTLKITIDTSPPIAGSVHDGTPDDNDIDFQQENTLHVHWDGFFDKESGVKFYEYIFDTKCWDTLPTVNVSRTTSTHVSGSAPSSGTYYVTVVAYNHALDPSTAVCSDGVTIDKTSPNLSDIRIQNSRIKPGIVADTDNNIWVVNANVEYKKVINASHICRKVFFICLQISPINKRSNAGSGQTLMWFEPSTQYQNVILDDCEIWGPSGDRLFITADKHIHTSWIGWDGESAIYDFYIALSSVASDLLPDIMPYVSTAGKHQFTLQHPTITHGSVFYLIVKAVNKAQMTSSKIFGPVAVDLTPPGFEGVIDIRTNSSCLHVCWENSSFFDDIDNDLHYKIGVGSHSQENSVDILPYTDMSFFTNQPIGSNPICVNIPRGRLHGNLHENQEYHVSIKATNTAGLSVVTVSPPFRQTTTPPTEGVVLDILPAAEQPFQDTRVKSSDVDVQLSNSSIRAHWFGFHHPHLDLSYLFGVGSRPGDVDVSNGYVFVGNKTNHEEFGLQLQYSKTYYVSITAVCETGNVTVTSDGITPMEMDADLPDSIRILDRGPRRGQHDQGEDDIDFQLSTSVVQALWNMSYLSDTLITNVFWSLEQMQTPKEGTISTWSVYQEYKDLGFTDNHVETDLSLVNGGYYRSKVRFCFHTVCYKLLTSDGFWVVNQPPDGSTVDVVSERKPGYIDIDVNFQEFQDATGVMDHYEWTLTDSLQAVLLPWQFIGTINSEGGMNHFSVRVEDLYIQRRCIFLLLRGYNTVGLSSTVSASLECNIEDINKDLIVIDSDHHVTSSQNDRWTQPDIDYITTLTEMSATWPTLRHHDYVWAVIEDNNEHDFQNGLPYPCETHQTLKCGHTENEFVNVDGLELMHGKRYRICIHANETNMGRALPAISVCSNGVVVDTIPPTTGNVWVGHQSDTTYQISKSEVVVNWEHFTDVEANAQVPHHSGIRYELAIGTEPGKDNVASYHRVGFTNRSVVTNLDLNNDIVYYATVKGSDLVGLASVSSSNAFSVDNTPPSVDHESSLSFDSAFFRSTTSIVADWNGIFRDDRSGIDYYEWAIGTKPGFSDIAPFSRTSDPMISYENLNLNLKEGHPYFITIKATNMVGLTTSKSFGAFHVDTTPPTVGHVYDTLITTLSVKDYDWATLISPICAAWEGFHDPHSSVVGYSWRLGLCKGCSDVLTQQYVGITNSTCANHVQVIPGFTYYATVTACNAADLCTSVTSDGITFDDSPPAIGKVYDGHSEEDVDFSPNRFLISAHWWGFNDPHSQISHYEWRVGTTPKSDDIVKAISAHHSEFALHVLENPLPINVTLYVTVRAYNRAGLWTESSSDGFAVDDTEPLIVQNVTRYEAFGVQNTHSQIPNDIIKISWNFDDFESSIKRQHIYLMSHFKGNVDIDSLEIGPSDTQYTLTNLSLHDGSRYTIRVVACNGAELCIASSGEEFLVDSTPPIVGTFAVASEHAANLGRHLEGWMNWSYNETNNATSLNLAWLGFSDLHSGISHYMIAIGSNFDEYDIAEASIFPGNSAGDSSDDTVHKAEIQANGNVFEYSRIYVSLWAINEVGLKSSRAFSAFDLALSGSDYEGVLVFVRRCEAHSCEGHCVCAPLEKLCPVILNDCTDVSEDNPNEEVEVLDVLHARSHNDTVTDNSSEDDIDYSPSLSFMAAVWKTTVQKGLPILRYEWSTGLDWSEGSEPQGVYDPALEQVWHDIGQDTSVIVTFNKANEMLPGSTYQMFIRAWYNDDTYAVFRSDGVTPYPFAPKASTLKGAHVNDINVADQKTDIDFFTNTNEIAVSWYGVFIRNREALQMFELALGTYPSGEDLRQFSENVVPTNQTQFVFTNLALRSGQRYFASVRAYNKAGLYTTLSSDGFVVDTQNPHSGVVRDGKGLYYQEYQSAITTASASWHGFYDLESYVDYHIWCVGSTIDPDECGVIGPTNVGLSLTAEREVENKLIPGHRYFSKVFAVDAAGLRSQAIIVTDGFIPDISPPVPLQKLQPGPNLISNPSFEDQLDWDVHPANSSHILSVGKGNAQDGSTVVVVHGDITKRIETVPGKRYMLTFFTTHVSSDENIFLHQEGLVEIPGESHVFRLYHRQNHGIISRDRWQRNVFHFIATERVSIISLKSLGGQGMQVDNISVEEITFQASNSSTLVEVHLQILNGKPFLQADWQFQDEESPIEEYMWAIGTVRGGTQLQDFMSLGDKTTAFITDLTLTHVSSVFVTVVARNKAGLTGVAYSKPKPVDFTPPEIVYVREEGGLTKDLDYTNNYVFYIGWEARDEETQIAFCDWAVGTQPNSDDTKAFTRVSEASMSNMLVQLPEHTNEGQKFYVTVQCQNTAGLSSRASSDGVTIVTSAPDASNAFLNIIASSNTEYDVRDMYQSHTNYIKGYWQGFHDIYGIKYYQCKITGPMISDTEWEVCGSIVSTSAELGGLSLVSGGQYHLEVRAINYANLASASIGRNVTIATEPPQITGQDVMKKWQNNDTLMVSWQDAFHSNTRLWYEVSIGTISGGSDVMQWVETTEFQISVFPLKKLTDYYITLTAINSVGLSSTINVIFNG
ncbi:uncharacterized protein [Amphiura filiformis]|uniref:uncharacterized protein n=1 Tax=Amphiura filiformis TaxID=82378 RepID=UPI003B21EBB9